MSIETLHRIEDKLDRIQEKIGSIDVTLSAQHVSLVEHIRRTVILEEKIIPLEKHTVMVHGALKLIGFVAMLGAIIESGVAFLSYVKR